MRAVLVVEDDKLFLDSLIRTLEGYFDIQGILDPSLILEKMVTKCPDIIILDYNMRPLNGIEVLKMIRSEGYIVPVIMISASLSSDMVAQALELDVNYILTKPIDGIWLIHIMNKLIQ